LAQNIVDGLGGMILTVDDFFLSDQGQFILNPMLLPRAHAWNLERAIQAVKLGIYPIIIDTTNSQKWEAKPYLELAIQFHYEFKVLETKNPWAKHPEQLARKSPHGTPLYVIQNMLNRWESDYSNSQILLAQKPDSKAPQGMPEIPWPSKQKVMIILRGLPGSGKTTLANRLTSQDGSIVLSTDQYFMRNGEYRFSPQELGAAHQWNQARSLHAVQNGSSPIIIDNTCTQRWEAYAYVKQGLSQGYDVRFLECNTSWAKNPAELAVKNSHGMVLNTIQRLLQRWDTAFTLPAVLNSPPLRPSMEVKASHPADPWTCAHCNFEHATPDRSSSTWCVKCFAHKSAEQTPMERMGIVLFQAAQLASRVYNLEEKQHLQGTL